MLAVSALLCRAVSMVVGSVTETNRLIINVNVCQGSNRPTFTTVFPKYWIINFNPHSIFCKSGLAKYGTSRGVASINTRHALYALLSMNKTCSL